MNPSDLLAGAAVGVVPVASLLGLFRQRAGRGTGPSLPARPLRGETASGAWTGGARGGGWPGPAGGRRPGGSGFGGPGRAGRAATGGFGHGRWRPRADTGARWARGPDLRPLQRGVPGAGRLVLGSSPPGGLGIGTGRPLAAERAQSVAVVGPTQSGKTTALAVPAILGWEGPVLAASVKTDLVRDTLAWRRRAGSVWCFDPAGTTGLPRSTWSPLDTAVTWAGARRLAADLTEVTRTDTTSADGEFWYATAAKLLAPLLFAAAVGGRTMHDVVRWVDEQETEEVLDLLHAAGVHEALQAARATWMRDERQRSAVYTTAETVLEPFAEMEVGMEQTMGDTPPYGIPACGDGWQALSPGPSPEAVGASYAGEAAIDCERLLTGRHTLYVCAPAHDQRRLRGLFVALVQQVLHAAFARSARTGRPLDPPLLVVLDEAANIAPLRDLDGLAATCAGHGVQLVTVWQDLAHVGI